MTQIIIVDPTLRAPQVLGAMGFFRDIVRAGRLDELIGLQGFGPGGGFVRVEFVSQLPGGRSAEAEQVGANRIIRINTVNGQRSAFDMLEALGHEFAHVALPSELSDPGTHNEITSAVDSGNFNPGSAALAALTPEQINQEIEFRIATLQLQREYGFLYRGVSGQFEEKAIELLQKIQESRGMGVTPVPRMSPPRCFPAGALITLADHSRKPIEDIRVGDYVLAFDPANPGAPGISAPVTKLFSNVTDAFLTFRAAPGFEAIAAQAGFTEVTMTPGHMCLEPDGSFRRADAIAATTRTLVLTGGIRLGVVVERILLNADTANLYEQATQYSLATQGALALAPQIEEGWRTWNFEVGGAHNYRARKSSGRRNLGLAACAVFCAQAA